MPEVENDVGGGNCGKIQQCAHTSTLRKQLQLFIIAHFSDSCVCAIAFKMWRNREKSNNGIDIYIYKIHGCPVLFLMFKIPLAHSFAPMCVFVEERHNNVFRMLGCGFLFYETGIQWRLVVNQTFRIVTNELASVTMNLDSEDSQTDTTRSQNRLVKIKEKIA